MGGKVSNRVRVKGKLRFPTRLGGGMWAVTRVIDRVAVALRGYAGMYSMSAM